MPRPSKDGTKARAANRRVLTDRIVQQVEPEARPYNIWDLRTPGLCLRVQPSGHRSFFFVYKTRGRPRWYFLSLINLRDARKIAAKLRFAAVEGRDPLAEREAERNAGSLAELAERYAREWSQRRNKSWEQADRLVRRHVLPRLGKLSAKSITRADVRSAIGRIAAPVLANQVLKSLSAIFTFAVNQEIIPYNPCKGIERNPTRSRERVVSDVELPKLWAALSDVDPVCGAALRVLLLTGQRRGEVARMRREHIEGGWWVMPGEPDKHGWLGTKNSSTHRVWLCKAVQDIVGDIIPGGRGFVFATSRGKPVDHLDATMRSVSERLGLDAPIRPHDLRRTHGTTITKLGFGRDAMNRIQNHKEGGISDVYDLHQYERENKLIMERVARHILTLAEGRTAGKVIPLR
jgi:integrase